LDTRSFWTIALIVLILILLPPALRYPLIFTILMVYSWKQAKGKSLIDLSLSAFYNTGALLLGGFVYIRALQVESVIAPLGALISFGLSLALLFFAFIHEKHLKKGGKLYWYTLVFSMIFVFFAPFQWDGTLISTISLLNDLLISILIRFAILPKMEQPSKEE
jgi:hypothetical protein